VTGIVDFVLTAGDPFEVGDLMAVVRNMAGEKLAEVRAEYSGFVVGWSGGIAFEEGDSIGSCGLPVSCQQLVSACSIQYGQLNAIGHVLGWASYGRRLRRSACGQALTGRKQCESTMKCSTRKSVYYSIACATSPSRPADRIRPCDTPLVHTRTQCIANVYWCVSLLPCIRLTH
jgi:hypothetical protein